LDNIGRFASKKPQIKVYYNENIKNIEYIKEILLGIEEEGIPYQVEDKQFGSAVEIAHEASLESTLGVGIGIDNNYIVLHYNKLKEELDLLEINYEENTNLVRGLDYYNHVVFEINVNIDGIDTLAIGGDGRYNNLVESLDGPSVPAVGFAIGFDRLMMCLDMAHVNIPVNNDVDVYIMYVSDTEKDTALYIAQNLRLNGFTTEMDYFGKGLKGQFKAADRFNAKYLVILNDKDLEDIVGLQTDSPLKRAIMPFGGIRIVEKSCEAYGRGTRRKDSINFWKNR